MRVRFGFYLDVHNSSNRTELSLQRFVQPLLPSLPLFRFQRRPCQTSNLRNACRGTRRGIVCTLMSGLLFIEQLNKTTYISSFGGQLNNVCKGSQGSEGSETCEFSKRFSRQFFQVDERVARLRKCSPAWHETLSRNYRCRYIRSIYTGVALLGLSAFDYVDPGYS